MTSIPSPTDDIDEIAVERACYGDRNIALTRAEMAEAFQRLTRAGTSGVETARILGVHERAVWRWRAGAYPKSRRAA